MSDALTILRKTKLFVYIFLIVVVAPAYVYFNLPVISPWFMGLPLEIFFISLMITALEIQVLKGQKSGLFFTALGTAVIALLYIVIMSLAGLPMFRADKYHKLLGEVKEGKSFAQDLAPVAPDKIRIVDKDVAHRLGDKVLGEEPALGSQVYIGEFQIQKVRDQLYWVAPLEHSGFFKWMSNKKGTHGYIMVSSTNERDVKLVREVKGKPVQIKYQMGGWFGDYLPRHLYLKGFITEGMDDYTFEIDDEGHPYWVVTLFKHEVGFSGNNAVGIAVVDATSGEVKKYTAKTAPEWVDRIQPKNFIENQINSWGEYVHGYWNFSNRDKLQATEGISLVYGNDNRSYWYTGITSVGSDESTIGFMLVDTRTKEATLYRQPGATENAAMQSAMGKVQEKGYQSSFPIMYNINGIATYVMSLKDQAGLIKMVAMVSVQDYSIVGVGDNLKDALRSYKDAYNNSGNKNPIVHDAKLAQKAAGKVLRISEDVSGGNSYYYMIIDNQADKIFIGNSNISRKLPLTSVGDSISINFEERQGEEVEMLEFENYNIKTAVKPKEEKKDN
jgi:hypothetical protein